jgi:CBS domain-containing protein
MNVEGILERKGTEVATIAPEASIKRAADWLRAKNVGALVVTSNDAILGIISERDIVRAFSQYGEPVAIPRSTVTLLAPEHANDAQNPDTKSHPVNRCRIIKLWASGRRSILNEPSPDL